MHLPGLVEKAQEIKGKGIDNIICMSVNDPWVMDAWAYMIGAEDITMLADGNAEITKAIDLVFDGSSFGLGIRSHRFAMLINDGRVEIVEVEDNPNACSVSSAPSILSRL